MPARKITKSAVANIFRFTSINKSEPVIVESYNEYLACYHLEFSFMVDDYTAQPKKFRFKDDETGKQISYTPDFWVRLKNGQEYFIEVKDFEETQKDKFIKRWEFIQRKLRNMGFEIKLLTDRDLNRGNIPENLKLLHRYLSRNEINEVQVKIAELIKKQPLTLIEICEQLKIKLLKAKSLILNLVARKVLTFKIYEEITENTLIWRCNE
ncbi:TnsA endonuclease N-terminal domain-containing protein [Alishewanella sp. WH16-1]|uniref:TnsA endonuclease N-terminal domain-containing protein n=1 Tax=Alishewanella sp. WH16-1 TaxID=1651088 RepID=UPI000708ECFE|nr:TnsA endonuclease N-terminal domain-containing protein [Alishewanella sp. WH16-1]